MSRLLIHVEGQTEETFVNEILAPRLYKRGYEKVGARLVGNARQRDRRGGIRAWAAVRNDIIRHLKEDPGSLATTFIDYYGLPQTGARAWPGRERSQHFSRIPKRPSPWNRPFLKTSGGNWGRHFIQIALSLS